MTTESSIDPPPEPPSLRIGCPVWACDAWVGSLYSSSSRRSWLGEYSTVFQTVEGNSTFYALPPLETIRRWGDETQDGFQFCLKFPGAVTHEKQLVDVRAETAAFLDCLEVLANANRLGPTFIQLPPFFSARQFDRLGHFLRDLPKEYPFAVEVRHLDYFDEDENEQQLDELLNEHGMDRVLFDSRALFSRPAEDPYEVKSQTRKPKSPLRHTVTGKRPFVRFVGRNKLTDTQPWIHEWADVVAGWLQEGLEPYVFTHAPDDAYAPAFAVELYNLIRSKVEALPELAMWPGQAAPKQRYLF